MPKHYFSLFLLLILGFPSYSQDKNYQLDIPKHKESLLEQSIVPTLLIGTGVWTVYTNTELNKFKVQRSIQNKYADFNTQLDSYLQFAPLAITLGYKIGNKDYDNWQESLTKTLLAEALMLGSVYTIKNTTRHKRPHPSEEVDSFPSGHTAQAFMAASILHKEIGDESHWLTAMGYTTAAFTGVLRVMNNKHYISDVLVGAGIGLLSTHVSYWVIDKIKQRKKARTFK
ncbi:phosphatase PAP2 family protein [Sediminitomix flava]|uniref:PAP2 superfamily protein n=1 Tax=Sediminitomix flava TaxID=379075 RepID=A0A315Z5H9_SEDFL|nr:phosphatase PAP2 family protein [Sediminitomix flava]PWJ39153.1 PAP2 superfamily protein [Sediminitomix flava]